MTPELAARIPVLRREGGTLVGIADAVGVSTDTVRRAMAAPAADPGLPEPELPIEQSLVGEPAVEPAAELPVLGEPARRGGERVAAGLRAGAPPVFTPCARVPLAGLFLALPGIIAAGLLDCAETVYSELPNGFYGLTPMLVEGVLRNLVGEPRAEGATRVNPVDLVRLVVVARYLDVHPDNPQLRSIAQLVDLLGQGGVIAYPTDSGYALGAGMGNVAAVGRIREIRHLSATHHFTLVCADMTQVGGVALLDNKQFRAIRAVTPGPYTFILRAGRDVPRRLAHPRRRTVGVRVPGGALVTALLGALGEPILSSTLLLPGQEVPMTDGWEVRELLDHVVDAVVDTGVCGDQPTTVVDWSGDEPFLVRVGGGDPARFE